MSSATINNFIEIGVSIDADASSGFTVTIPRALSIVDCVVAATAAVATTATITDGDGNTIVTNPATGSTIGDLARPTNIDGTYSTLAAAATIVITTGGATEFCTVTITCHAPGATL